MRLLIVSAMLFCSSQTVSAQSICRIYEYAELKDMPRDKLISMFCEYDARRRARIQTAANSVQRGDTGGASRDMDDANRCSREQGRMERILQSQHSTPKPLCAK